MSSLASRAIDVDQRQCELGNEVFRRAGATFVRNTASPSVYDANHVAAVSVSTPEEIAELFAAMDEEFQHTSHRRVHTDRRTPPEFVARLVLDGHYEREDGLLLVLEGELRASPPRCDIRPVETDADWEALWELSLVDWVEHHRRTGRGDGDESTARQMWATKRLKQPPVQYWLAFVDGRPVGFFNSWAGVGGAGQVEDLFVLPDFRRRGIATALIHHCVTDARRRGERPVVIAADPTDTPKQMYAAMGWRPVAVVTRWLRKLSTS